MQPALQFYQVFFKSDGKIIKLNLQEILVFEASDKYVKIITTHKPFLILSTIQKIEKGMFSHIFCRVHRSYMINLLHIVHIYPDHVHMGSIDVPMHKDYFAALLNRLPFLN